jgi:D-sedoheptulose 7-phosphate isomerase
MVESRELIETYFAEMKTIVDLISRETLDRAIELLFGAWKGGNQVFICGNGGSASTASHFACDLSKATSVDGKRRFKATSLNENAALLTALVNDNGFANLFSEQLRNSFQKGDILVCISVHGGSGRDKAEPWSQNLLKAIQLAKDTGGRTIGFSGFDGGVMKEMVDVCVVVPFNSTPQVESFHLAIEHLICLCLKHKIERA